MLQRTTRITTASGKRVLKSNCCTINGEYYIKEEEAVKIGTSWYLKQDPRIFYDYGSQSWRKTRGVNICKGVVGWDSSNTHPIIGAFEVDHTRNIDVAKLDSRGNIQNMVTYMDRSLLQGPVHYNKNLGIYEDTTALSPILKKVEGVLANTIGQGVYNYSFNQEYSSSKHMEKFLKYPRDMRIDNPINIPDVKEFGEFSFGLEFETAAGKLSQAQCFNLGLIPLRDGSISGIEYTTIPMKGPEGFNLLINQVKTLQKSTTFDKDCSLHVHLGGFPVEAKSIWALYKLLVIIEPQIARIMPYFAFNTGKFKSKGKDYCTKLRKYPTFEEYYTYCSGDRMRFDGNLTYPHPMDEEDRAKWNIHARYVWANLINMLFKKQGKTVEFRIHAPTFNIQKIVNWMFICSGILQFAIKNKDRLLKSSIGATAITLEDIISNIYSHRVSLQLTDYIQYREVFFKQLANKYSDPAGLIDLRIDQEQDFGTNLVTTVQR